LLLATQPWTGGGAIVFDGGGSTFSPTTAGFNFSCTLPGLFTIQNAQFSSSNAAYQGHIANNGIGVVTVGSGLIFGTCGTGGDMMSAMNGGILKIGSDFTVNGNCRELFYAKSGGIIDLYAGRFGSTTTISANITISTFAFADPGGTLLAVASARTFSLGAFTVTGQRYNAQPGGVIFTQGGGVNYFPGNTAGSPATVSTSGTYG
jgi:hypothetical protein